MALSQTQIQEMTVTAGLAAVENIAKLSITGLYDAATLATHNLNDALIRMGFSNDIIDSINSPEVRSAIQNSMQDMQAQIQNSIDLHSSNLDFNIRAANYASDLVNLTKASGYLLASYQLVKDTSSGNSKNIGNDLIGGLAGLIAGTIAEAIIGSLGIAGLSAIGLAVGAALGAYALTEWLVTDEFKEMVGDSFKDLSNLIFSDFFDWLDPNNISKNINDLFNNSKNWTPPRRDPLAIDLDDDGIETIGADGSILFDHNGDGVKTGTGWVGADDGFLVMDHNANGIIDTGAELFGIDTIKADGSNATNGFDALSELDSNGEGVFDAQDAEFTNVQIWQDQDQDGVSDEGELSSLSENGIVSIDLNAEINNVNLGNGNVQTAASAHLTLDGEEGTTGNLDLASNSFYSEFTDSIPLTDAALALPESKGSGMVRDLREAMSLSSDLTNVVSSFAEQTSYVDQRAQLDTLISGWADTSTMKTSTELALEQNLILVFMVPGQTPSDFNGSFSSGGSCGDSGILLDPDAIEAREALLAKQAKITQMISILEIFNGDQFVAVNTESVTTGTGREIFSTEKSSNGFILPTPTVFLSLSQAQIDPLEQSYDQLKESVYGNLVVQTRLSDYTNAVKLSFDEVGNIVFDFSTMEALLNDHLLTNPTEALADLIDLTRYVGPMYSSSGWNGLDMLQSWIDQGVGGEAAATVFSDLGVLSVNEATTGTNKSEIIIDRDNASTLKGMGGNDIIHGDLGNDWIYGGNGNDTIYGDEGNDYLYGNAGNDVLNGGEGSDHINGGDGDDTIRGGSGNGDYLSGDSGNDTYLFGAGDGNITISKSDAAVNRMDVLRFLEGISSDDVSVARSEYHLNLTVGSTGEVIKVGNYFRGDGAGGYALNAIEFADGTSWDLDTVKAMALEGTSGNDNMTGHATDDVINGAAGNDWIYGGNGDDTVYGDEGNDYLFGNAGNDVLNGGDGSDHINGGAGDDTIRGGAGNGDYLSGDSGNDTYLFGAGDGNITISNSDAAANRMDVLRFLEGISSDDVSVARSDDHLNLTVGSTGEVIKVGNYFRGDGTGGYALNAIEFADGTSWDLGTVKAMALEGTAGNDKMTGYATDDVINGAAGNDWIYGGSGDDTVYGDEGNDYLYGNAGNDVLNGGDGSDHINGGAGDDTIRGGASNGDYLSGDSGNDTYLFSTGDGVDTISNYDTNTASLDVVYFEDVSIEDLWFSRSGNHLEITVAGTDDRVRIANWYSNTNYQLDQIEVGTSTLLNNQVDQLVSAMAAFDVPGGAGNVIPQDVIDQLQPVLVESWQVS